MPQQIAGLGAGIDDVLDVGASEIDGRRPGELALADAGLAAHQQRAPGGQGGVDGVDFALVEDVHLLRGGLGPIQEHFAAVNAFHALHGKIAHAEPPSSRILALASAISSWSLNFWAGSTAFASSVSRKANFFRQTANAGDGDDGAGAAGGSMGRKAETRPGVDSHSLQNQVGDLRRRATVDPDIAVGREQPGNGRVVEAQGHDGGCLALLDQIADGSPFEAAPVLALVIGAQKYGDQFGFVVIETLQIGVEIGAGKLGLVVLVVQDSVATHSVGQPRRDRFHEIPVFAGEGKRDLESLRAHGR